MAQVVQCPAHRVGLVVLVHDRGLERLGPRCGRHIVDVVQGVGLPARRCMLQPGHRGGCE